MKRFLLTAVAIASLATTARAIEVKGVDLFNTSQLEELAAVSSTQAEFIYSLWENYMAEGFYDLTIEVHVDAETTLVVTEGRQYRLNELKYHGIKDSVLQTAIALAGTNAGASEDGIARLLEIIAGQYANAGYPYPAITIDSLGLLNRPPQLYVNVNSGPRVDVAGVSFEGLRVTRSRVLENFIDIQRGETFSEADVQQSYHNLQHLDFVRTAGEPDVVFRPAEKNVDIIFPLREERNFAFDGLGYLTPDNQLAGSINATLRNIFGYGERFYLDWQRTNATSSRLGFDATAPRIFSTPIDAGIELQQRDRDSSFVRSSARLSLAYHFSLKWNVSATFGWSKVTPEEERLTDAARVLAVDLRTIYDSRIQRERNRGGVILEYSFQSAYRREFPAGRGIRSGYSRRLEGEFTLLQPLTRDIIWRQRLSAFQAASDFEPVPVDELVEVGGPESIRGYRDNSFFADLGMLASTELRWLALENFALLVFSDNGLIKTEQADLGLSGFGAGMLISTSVGDFRFEAALGEEKSLDKMLVHFGFTGEL